MSNTTDTTAFWYKAGSDSIIGYFRAGNGNGYFLEINGERVTDHGLSGLEIVAAYRWGVVNGLNKAGILCHDNIIKLLGYTIDDYFIQKSLENPIETMIQLSNEYL